ncbi:hypothetical protein CpipJ_CPIJ009865 [Culex quinquefasciatus]|uniref:Uncharacterized protein n=1 Tax=Culex quinquefasciatus TaxID=7176 RepID=B0WRH1_CULQU|nr:hypothetical protein CpipJ_CPIJ009865 [Culex quinquefasciatus]|eukprot:XP_001851305.1 hypothetical protein CpipJ_CPIJ009865 [Culex quinquefasciatus]
MTVRQFVNFSGSSINSGVRELEPRCRAMDGAAKVLNS